MAGCVQHFEIWPLLPSRFDKLGPGYSSTAMGMVMGLAVMTTGWMYVAHGGAAFYAMAALSLTGGVVAVLLGGGSGRRS